MVQEQVYTFFRVNVVSSFCTCEKISVIKSLAGFQAMEMKHFKTPWFYAKFITLIEKLCPIKLWVFAITSNWCFRHASDETIITIYPGPLHWFMMSHTHTHTHTKIAVRYDGLKSAQRNTCLLVTSKLLYAR